MKHKITKRLISTIIALLLIMEALPLSVFASSNKKHPTKINLQDSLSIADIAKEVNGARTEFSKTYLLEDGSYCNISSYSPIHKKVNGKWKNINTVMENNVNSIEDAKSLIQTALAEKQDNRMVKSNVTNIGNDDSSFSSSVIVNASGCSVSNGVITLVRGSALVAKPAEIKNYHDQNKLVVHATVDMNCTVNTNGAATIELKEKTGSWTENTNFASTSFSNDHVLDSCTCSTSGQYSWDLTDLYSKWDKNVLDNNGFVLAVSSRKSNVTINNLCVTVIYRNVDETDMLSTYHTIDMSRAGKLYIAVFPSISKKTSTVQVLKSPKTISSVRKIFLPKTVAKMLKEWKRGQDEEKDLLGGEYTDYNLVFAGSFGMPVEGATIRNAMKKLIEENNLPPVVFHSLRHSSITYKLKLNGGDIKSVQGDSGHAQAQMVTDQYSHIIDEDRAYNAQLFEDAFYNRMQEQSKQLDLSSFVDIDPELLNKVLKNPEIITLLQALAQKNS